MRISKKTEASLSQVTQELVEEALEMREDIYLSKLAEEAEKRANERERIAEEKARMAEEKARIAEEKAMIADEKAKQADKIFQKSMKK